MKLPERFKRVNSQTRWMIAVIVLLLAMIVSRWGYISRTAGEAFKQRVISHMEQIDTTAQTKASAR